MAIDQLGEERGDLFIVDIWEVGTTHQNDLESERRRGGHTLFAK